MLWVVLAITIFELVLSWLMTFVITYRYLSMAYNPESDISIHMLTCDKLLTRLIKTSSSTQTANSLPLASPAYDVE